MLNGIFQLNSTMFTYRETYNQFTNSSLIVGATGVQSHFRTSYRTSFEFQCSFLLDTSFGKGPQSCHIVLVNFFYLKDETHQHPNKWVTKVYKCSGQTISHFAYVSPNSKIQCFSDLAQHFRNEKSCEVILKVLFNRLG